MPVIVQKFGGTSVSTPESREAAVARVVSARQQGFQPVVVISAMGRHGDPYATDTLIELGKDSLEKRELDLIMVCGEIVASAVFVTAMRQHIPQVALLTGWQAGILTDDRHGDARIVDVQADRVSSLLSKGYSVVVAGFQGMNKLGEITTLGRGGSDTTAAAMGVALSAAAVEIYTDVDGIMTADPRLVPDARVLSLMDYSEVLQMAYEGAKVLHPRAVEMAMQKNIPLLVKRTTGNHPGTRVVNTVLYEGQRRQPVIGIAYQANITQFEVLPEASMSRHDADFFDSLVDAGIGVDLVHVSPERILFVVRDEDVRAVQELLKRVPVRTRVRSGCAKVSVIGIGMRGVHGVMARVVRALADAGIEIFQTSDSHLSITCLISHSGLTKAANALHRSFALASLE